MTGSPGGDAKIRPARPGEAGLVLDFVRELAEYEDHAHEVVAGEAEIDTLLFGPEPGAFCDFAVVGGEPVGFALWFYNASTFHGRRGIYLEDLYVRPAARGRGIGKALLAGLARRCVAEGLTRLQWWVLDTNAPAIAFYRSLGATAMDEWTVFRVSDVALSRLAAGAP